MLRHSNKFCGLMLCASVAALIAASPALAQDAQPTPNATETAVGNLLQGLVDQGVLKRAKAQALMNKFHSDLAKAPPAAPAAATPAAAEPGTVAVPYIPEIVKDEITNRVKQDVVKQAKDEHWATPNSFPEWVSRIKITGDFRMRDEGRFFDQPVFQTQNGKQVQVGGNELSFVDVNTVNANGGYNTGANNSTLPALLNSSKDRNNLRIRARLGITADITEDWTASFRLASGSDNSPVSTNQTLGGFFSKKSIWLDQAYVKYEPAAGNSLMLGRMPNPFTHTEMVWDDDINPDGVALSLSHDFHGLSLHATGAAFSIDYAGDAAPATALSDAKSGNDGNKWLFAGQIGAATTLKTARPLTLSLDAAYYDYDNIQGQLSPSCSNLGSYCLTDWSKPGFVQKGNTLFGLRNFNYPDSTNPTSVQIYGLASKFQVLDLIAKADLAASDNFHITLTGDVARNLGYSAKSITGLPIVNNNETCSGTVPAGKSCTDKDANGHPYGTPLFKSGKDAWYLRLDVGAPRVENRWEWNIAGTYEYIQPDALVDAFTDSDFHLGGTNAKGWTLAGNLGLAHNTWLTAKWLSADAVSGPHFSVDVLQVDLNVRF
jgi:hypothetical protein